MNTEPTQCKYEAIAHGRCFRPTMRPDGLCFYHNPEAMAKRKPKRLSRKALQAERDGLLLQLGEAYEVLALACRGSKGERDCYLCAAPEGVPHYDDSPCKILNQQPTEKPNNEPVKFTIQQDGMYMVNGAGPMPLKAGDVVESPIEKRNEEQQKWGLMGPLQPLKPGEIRSDAGDSDC